MGVLEIRKYCACTLVFSPVLSMWNGLCFGRVGAGVRWWYRTLQYRKLLVKKSGRSLCPFRVPYRCDTSAEVSLLRFS